MFSNLVASMQKGGFGGKLAAGTVTDNNDPTRNQRIKYRIATLHDGQDDAELVWAIPLGWGAQGNTPGGMGSIAIPPIGGKVIIFFPENDAHDTYYMADFHDNSTKISELLEDYPHSYGHIDATGNLLLINTQQNTVRFVHVTGTYIKISPLGAVELGCAKSLTIYSGDVLTLRALHEINIDAATMNVNIGLSPTLTTTPRTRPT